MDGWDDEDLDVVSYSGFGSINDLNDNRRPPRRAKKSNPIGFVIFPDAPTKARVRRRRKAAPRQRRRR